MSVPTHDEVSAAADALRGGELVAFPTETVYGLGADASNPVAVERLYRTKRRPNDHPLIVHIASAGELERWAKDISDAAYRLAERFWPGPLTIILHRREDVPSQVSGGLATIGLRVPDHPVALELLRSFSGGIAAPSANRFQHVSPTSASHVRNEFRIGPNAEVAVLLDGGPCAIGVESTIVELVTDHPMILRSGAISALQVAEVAHADVDANTAGPSRAPGMLDAHYQPRAEVHLAENHEEALAMIAQYRSAGRQILHIADPDDIAAFAQELYRLLRHADDIGASVVVAELPAAADGLSAAVRDRLVRAATPAG